MFFAPVKKTFYIGCMTDVYAGNIEKSNLLDWILTNLKIYLLRSIVIQPI